MKNIEEIHVSNNYEKTHIKQLWREKAVINTLIIIINVIVFLVLDIMGSTENAEFMLNHGAMFSPYIIENKEYYRIFTSMFMHFGINHIINNMLILFFMGGILERSYGKIRYLIIYILGGVSGNIASIYFSYASQDMYVSAGASGAVFAVIGAVFYITIINYGKIEDMSAKKMAFMIALSMYLGFTGSGVDNYAHVGGLAGGLVLAILLCRRKKKMDNN